MVYNPQPTPRKERKPRRPRNPLVGKCAVISHFAVVFYYQYFEDGRVLWRSVTSHGVVREGVFRATYLQIDDHIHMLTWLTDIGVSMTQTIDTLAGSVRTVTSQISKRQVNRISIDPYGKFEFVDGWEGGNLSPKKGRIGATEGDGDA